MEKINRKFGWRGGHIYMSGGLVDLVIQFTVFSGVFPLLTALPCSQRGLQVIRIVWIAYGIRHRRPFRLRQVDDVGPSPIRWVLPPFTYPDYDSA